MFSDNASSASHLFFMLNLLIYHNVTGYNSSTLHDTFMGPPNLVTQVNNVMQFLGQD